MRNDDNFSSEESSQKTKLAGSGIGNEDSGIEVSPELERSSIGRFNILGQLGKGGFGYVYLADDSTLNRKVAIKVPRWDRTLTRAAMERFQVEGRMLAQVNHTSIVSVYDVATTDDGIPFVVMEYVDGATLSSILKSRILTIQKSLDFLLAIAVALKEAHKCGLVHRDFKPGNVIVKDDGKISLVDFGLALHDDLSPSELQDSSIAGTPSYMAPEQLRGENHLIGGQTDIWAFGVTMYRMLVGVLPFKGGYKELSRAIRYKNPRPPRQLNDQIPRQLELICLRCLQKLMEDRYQSMADVIDELNAYVTETAEREQEGINLSESPSIRKLRELGDEDSHPTDSPSRSKRSATVSESASHSSTERERLTLVPKGLRSFDQNDREFFLKLLPGPTDRHGIPESIRFWNSRLDQTQQVEEVKVGIIYGPSGCGKSSFVRAGLIPRLADCVIPIYVDCTNDDLAGQIVRQIRQDVHSIPADISLVELMIEIRRGKFLRVGDKLLLVLDQFEQWLNGNIEYSESELTNALRQCDSKSIQTLLLLRDEFWLSASQFMKCLDQRIEESRNAMALPLFDQRHARRVLEAFGRAYNRLPVGEQKLTSQQNRFVKEAVSALSNRGKVICVHLAVFAETAKNQPWNIADLRSMGGWEGIGREFISGIFQNPETPNYIKKNSGEAWSILRQLLPVNETELKGKTVSKKDLQFNSGLEGQPTKFDELMEFLEFDSRLISTFENTDAIHSLKDHAGDSTELLQLYGLTHDFLVKPIRSWGMAKQNETRQGRADALLNNLSEQWAASKSDRYYPTDWDFARIMLFGSRASKKNNADLWERSKRRALMRSAIFGTLLAMVFASWIWFQMSQNQSESVRIVQAYLNCETDELEDRSRSLLPFLEKTEPLLRRDLSSNIAKRRTRAAIALLRLAPTQPELRLKLLGDLANLSPDELAWTQEFLSEFPEENLRAISSHLEVDSKRLSPRLAVLGAILGEPKWLNLTSRLDADPNPRLDTIDTISECYQLAPALINALRQNLARMDPTAISCVFCGLGQIKSETLERSMQTTCEAFVVQQYLESPDCGVHLAAHYALSMWGCRIPEFTAGSIDAATWCEFRLPGKIGSNIHRILLVKINKGSYSMTDRNKGVDLLEHDGFVAEDYWISSFEIPLSLYQEYHVEEHGEPLVPYGTDGHPKEFPANTALNTLAASDISPANALKFVDWLNSKVHEGSWVNEPVGVDRIEFSLPTTDEFELASRAKSETDCYFADVTRADTYVGEAGNKFGFYSGQFPPNGFGLHDTAANLSEWVIAKELVNNRFGIKGTSDAHAVEDMKSSYSNYLRIDYTDFSLHGFRVVLRSKK